MPNHERKVVSSNAVITTGYSTTGICNCWDYDPEHIWSNHFQLHDSRRYPFVYSCNRITDARRMDLWQS
jgi:hypothetical protein